jgi:flagellar M-ring protein FliF
MDQAKKLLASLSNAQRFAILFCAAAVVGGVMWFSHWQRESGMRPLYTSLAPEDAGAIVLKLRESGVDYRVTDNGTTLMVPDAKAPELRLQMAGLGLPKTGRIGFEIFDKTNFGITDFAEHVNYRRAVEGELERSIMALAEVQQARVHVTLPKESVFLEAREAAKASILVGLRPGARLSPQNVTAITNLVSSAVEGLSPESVSLVDLHGNLLSRPRRDQLDGGQNTEAALEYRQAVERDLTVKVNNTLEPLLGANRFRTGVSAEVDMTSGEQSEESFDPTKSVMVTSQKTEDTSSVTHLTGSAAAAAAPGTAANLPTPPPPATPPHTGNANGSTKRTESISYQSSRTTRHTKLPQGAVKRLSVAVLVDQTVRWEGEGKQLHQIVTPPSPEKLKTIQSVVATLVGLNTQRGDLLTVETLPFDSTLSLEPPSAAGPPPKKQEPAGPLDALKNKPILFGAVGGGVLITAVLLFGLSRARKKRMTVEMDEPLPLPAASVSSATNVSMLSHNPGVPALPPSRTEVLLNQLQEAGKNNPELWVGILRGWLAEEEPS